MGCGDACPIVSAKQRIDWQIPDPIGESEIFFREIRDQIERKVRELLKAATS
jgi:protein-tyrosine-phosphatase